MDNLTLKFNRYEFNVWKFQKKTVFEFQSLMDIVDRTEVKPENKEATDIWLKNDKKTCILIDHTLESA